MTTGPLIGISVIFAEFSKRWGCGRILKDLYCHDCDNRCGVLDARTMSSSAEFRSLPLTMCMDAPEFYHMLSFLWLNIRKRVDCGFVLFFELVDAFNHFPRVSVGAPLLLRRFLPRICRQILEHRGYADEVQNAEYQLGMDPFIPEFSRDVMYLLGLVRCAVPRVLCPSVQSTWTSAALHPETRSPIASNSSTRQQILFHQAFSASCEAVNLFVSEHAHFPNSHPDSDL